MKGPLLRAKLLRLGDEEHVLLLTMHHIVSDGWSMGVLIREMERCMRHTGREEESPLKELGIQYADYAVWQREWLQGEVLEERSGTGETVEGAAGVRDADRPCASGDVKSSRWKRTGGVDGGVDEEGAGDQPARRCDGVHDAAGGVSGDAGQIYGANRHRGGNRCCESEPGRDRGADRIFRKSGGVARDVSGNPRFEELLGGPGGWRWKRMPTRMCRSSG